MQDKSISEVFNRTLGKSKTHFSKFEGRNNHLKTFVEGTVAYSYLDAFQSDKKIKFDLVTVKLSIEGEPEVYKNSVHFDPPYSVPFNDHQSTEVVFEAHPRRPKLVLASLHFQSKDGKRKSKLCSFEYDWNSLKKSEAIYFTEYPTHKGFIRALWHPFYQGYAVILKKDELELAKIEVMNEEIINRVSLKQLDLGQQIVDFRFWPQAEGIRKYLIIAVGKSGRLHILICPLEVDQESSSLSLFQREQIQNKPVYHFSWYSSFEFPLNADCLGIEIACPPKTDYILLFRHVSARKNNHQVHSVIVSALFQIGTQIQEKIILNIHGQNDGPRFYLPENCLSSQKFYFWSGDQLNLVDMSAHITGLKQLQQQKKHYRIPETIQSNFLFKVPLCNLKFLVIQFGGLKLLRKAQASHQYKFSNIPVDILSLELEEKTASSKLNAIFRDLEGNIKDLTWATVQPSSHKVEAQIKCLSKQGDEKEIQEILENTQKYLNDHANKLLKEKEEIDGLFQQANDLSHHFSQHKESWKELQEVLNRIDNNAKTIDSFKQKGKQDQEDDQMHSLEEMHNYLKSKPITISEKQRERYMDVFNSQAQKLRQVRKTIEDVQRSLKLYSGR